MDAQQSAAQDGITRISLAELLALRRQLPRRLAPPVDRVHAVRSGGHVTTVRGRGMDYRESRAYQHGDDIRRLDWRLTARSGKLHTKLFQEERERSLMVLLDTNATLRFGTRRRFKSVQAARAAALAAWLGIATNMRVGLAAFGSARRVARPQAGSRGAFAIMHALCETQSTHAEDGRESLSAALQRVSRLVRNGSQVLLISDGASLDAETRAALVALRRHAAVRVLVVADALESALAPAGRYPIAWQSVVRTLDLQQQAARVKFRETLGRAPHRLQMLARELQLPCRRIETQDEPMTAVAQLLGISLGAKQT
ncbi:DUF58 domain-containing protein [Oleiagrimonas soli]|uniref:Uncharacterized protein (DUF58 family) n=2 Tax=Oleiagrimonas soli TaxID=1543381 RepID=A0A099CTM4_9GAMM|nr:DUF58 domain-containing protein [Oleiagrimonas soli]KGI76967.1 hypothetical protein LF63_0112960 [Oleiagrimonas soli]MBB6185314.1 uncharacterized protein (DUF58 family) [Oleiagrimonas soli]